MTWTRRNFLRTLSFGAGASLLAPLFSQIAWANASLDIPRRFVIVLEGNGVEPKTLLSPSTRTAIEAQGQAIGEARSFRNRYGHSAPILNTTSDLGAARSLDPLLAGNGGESLESDAAVVLGLSSKVTGGGHSSNFGALSCARANATSPASETIDHHLAQLPQVRRATPFDALRLGITARISTRLMYFTCAFGPNRPAPVIATPTTAFHTVFGAVASAQGQRVFRKRGELLDYARTDVTRALGAFGGNSRERAKLERYLESVELLASRQQRLESLTDVLRQVKPEGPETSALYGSERPFDRLEAHFDIATAALLGGLTNVVVLASGTGGGFDLQYDSIASGLPGRHDLHHQSPSVPNFVEAIHDVTRGHVGLIANMARRLKATPELGANGTMLDHTAIIFMSDNGEMHHATGEEWPMLFVGGRALGFQTDGRSVVFPAFGEDNNRQVSNVCNTLGYAACEELDAFGLEGSSRIAQGPLSEIWAPV